MGTGDKISEQTTQLAGLFREAVKRKTIDNDAKIRKSFNLGVIDANLKIDASRIMMKMEGLNSVEEQDSYLDGYNQQNQKLKSERLMMAGITGASIGGILFAIWIFRSNKGGGNGKSK